MKKRVFVFIVPAFLLCIMNAAGFAQKKTMPASPQRGEIEGHEWVDLGLPSGLKWATCNLGASSPEEYGDYFSWGETRPKIDFLWENYRFRISGISSFTVTFSKYNTDSEYGTVDNKTQLDLSDDAARVIWGGRWRIPTKGELDELLNHCTWTWTTQGGNNGFRVESKTNGNSIFLPAGGGGNGPDLSAEVGGNDPTNLYNVGSEGYYWSSSLVVDTPYFAWYLVLDSFGPGLFDNNRYFGFSIRPVIE